MGHHIITYNRSLSTEKQQTGRRHIFRIAKMQWINLVTVYLFLFTFRVTRGWAAVSPASLCPPQWSPSPHPVCLTRVRPTPASALPTTTVRLLVLTQRGHNMAQKRHWNVFLYLFLHHLMDRLHYHLCAVKFQMREQDTQNNTDTIQVSTGLWVQMVQTFLASSYIWKAAHFVRLTISVFWNNTKMYRYIYIKIISIFKYDDFYPQLTPNANIQASSECHSSLVRRAHVHLAIKGH